MSLLPRVPVGSQPPRVLRCPETRVTSRVEDVLDLWSLIGRTLDPWQEVVVDAATSVDGSGRWAATEFGFLVSRQNGKGDILAALAAAHLFLWPKPDGEPKTLVHSAHQFKTAREAFRRLSRLIRSKPLLMREVLSIRDAHGEEGIELKNGNRLLFLARSRNSGLGFTIDMMFCDEAQELSSAALDAVLPTLSAPSNTQIVFAGTVPDELNESEVWEGLRDRGRSGSGLRTGWVEFNPEGSDDPDKVALLDVTDPVVLRAGNPAVGYRAGLTLETVQDEASRMSRSSVLRLRLSVWPNKPAEVVARLSELDMSAWRRHAGDYPVVGAVEGTVIAVALGRHGGFATVAAARRYDSDQIMVEHKRTDRQTRWVAEYVKQLKSELGNALVVIDPKNATPIIAAFEQAKIKFLAMNLDEIASAHAIFIEYVNDGSVIHRDQVEVTSSLESATTRALGRAGQTWEASELSKPITHAQAVTWAVWGVLKSEARPARKPTIVRGYA